MFFFYYLKLQLDCESFFPLCFFVCGVFGEFQGEKEIKLKVCVNVMVTLIN